MYSKYISFTKKSREEETVAFYFSIGCIEAEEINKELYEGDPRDFQLEFSL
jgi:hypothetical protein